MHYECTECATCIEPDGLITTCPECKMPLIAHYDLGARGRSLHREALAQRLWTVWRYREVLPLRAQDHVVSLGEGGTPLLRLGHAGEALGLPQLFAKDESQNPTGTFKARGMSVAVSLAKAHGAQALCVPSAGNAAGALAAYAAKAGLPAIVVMPEDAPSANRFEAEFCGARVVSVPGNLVDCARWLAERREAEGWFDLSTLKEPGRVEGKKTMGYEIAEQLDWSLPDVIVYPTGGGTGLVGIHKAIGEMRDLGWIDANAPMPRFVAVQAEGCAPIVEAMARGSKDAIVPEEPETIAAGVRVPTPIGARWMLRVLRESGGCAIAVSDAQILEATGRLARTEGICVAPEAGALVAALPALFDSGQIRGDDRVLLLLTGTGLKYQDCLS